jgi:plasmid maintenance system killer protein
MTAILLTLAAYFGGNRLYRAGYRAALRRNATTLEALPAKEAFRLTGGLHHEILKNQQP